MATEIVRELVGGEWVTKVGTGGGGGDVTAADVDSGAAGDGEVLTADGAGGAAWEAGGGSQPVTVAEATLTDAQIKALPTTPVELVAAPAAGTIRLMVWAALVCDTSTADYENIGDDAQLFIAGGSDVAEVRQTLGSGVSALLAAGNAAHVVMAPKVWVNTTVTSRPGAYVRDNGGDAITIGGNNNDSEGAPQGDFTEGDAAQVMHVRVAYIDIDVS